MKEQATPTRREFLYSTGLTLGGALAGASLSATPAEAIVLKVRPDIATLTGLNPLLKVLKAGVKAMKDLDISNPSSPLNWTSLAKIHLNFCPHGNWFFLPWHRAYLYYFEQVCRKASGSPSFVLPYWDWTKSPRLPAQFWGAGNPLMNTTRKCLPNDSANPNNVGQDVIYGGNGQTGIVNITDFVTFASGVAVDDGSGNLTQIQRQGIATGRLEGTPHNYIHGTFVRGDMATYMSPLDPIFWLHHANIDRLWTVWVKNNPGKMPSATDPNGNYWLNFTPQGFDTVRSPGQPVLKVKNVLNTTQLGYRYDTQTVLQLPQPLAKVFLKAPLTLTAEKAVGQTATVAQPALAESDVPTALRTRINQVRKPVVAAAAANITHLKLTIEVKPPQDLSTVVRVFLNSPNADANTPIGDPSYVGSISFFGQDHANHSDANSKFTFDVTTTVRNLTTAGLFKDEGKVQISLIAERETPGSEAQASVQLVGFKLEALS